MILLSKPLPSGISWASDPPTPPGISNSLRGGGLDIFWNHTFMGLPVIKQFAEEKRLEVEILKK